VTGEGIGDPAGGLAAAAAAEDGDDDAPAAAADAPACVSSNERLLPATAGVTETASGFFFGGMMDGCATKD
jgi:hypothetical protein